MVPRVWAMPVPPGPQLDPLPQLRLGRLPLDIRSHVDGLLRGRNGGPSRPAGGPTQASYVRRYPAGREPAVPAGMKRDIDAFSGETFDLLIVGAFAAWDAALLRVLSRSGYEVDVFQY